jgi:serine phosphatase RsbU (regulator of sigma subunit)/Tfp pilus assembly protein PilF
MFSNNLFAQKELRQLLDKKTDKGTQISDSLMNLINHTKNDTLRYDIYFEYLENISTDERKEILVSVISQIDSILSHKKLSESMRKPLLNRKGQFYVWYAGYYDDTEGANSERQIECLSNSIKAYKEAKNPGSAAVSYINKANCYFKQGKLMKQLQTLQEGLKYEIEQKYDRGIARFYLNLQLFYAEIGDTTQTTYYVKKSIEINKIIGDSTSEARGCYLTGLTYGKLNQSKLAIEFYLKSLELYKKEYMSGRERIFQVYGELANEYIKLKQYNKALAVYEDLEAEGVKRNEIGIIFKGTMGKGSMKSMLGQHKEAVKIHSDILKLAEEANQAKSGVGRTIYTALAEDYFRAGDYKNAGENMDLALSLSDNDPLFHKYTLQELAYKIDSASKNYEGAFKHFYQMNKLKELINKEDVSKSLTKEKFINDLNEFKREQEKQDLVNEQEKNKQRFFLNSVLVILFILVLFALVIFRSLHKTRKANKIIAEQKQEVEHQKHIVEEKHKEITDSINYAERIQRSFLASDDLLNKYLKNYFIYFKPKDVVSGDFYWASTIVNSGGDENFILATADSTGHGVPGAIMSLLNITSLEKAIEHLTNPADILNHTRQTIINRLKRDGSAEGGKDGMDCSLLVFDFKKKQLHIAAAHNPVWVIRSYSPFEGGDRRSGDVELIEIKADKMPVGKHDRDQESFTSHIIDIKDGDVIYTLTDGFPDQFGGDKGKKFMSKNLKELLMSNAHLSMNEQKELLNDTFTKWVGNLEQVDDVTLIGIKI